METATLTDQVLSEITAIGRSREPKEAVGVITPDGSVLELVNRSSSPNNSFLFRIGDLATTLDVYQLFLSDEEWRNLVIWHTHPAGGVGPSRVDMKSKINHFGHLVVALTPEGPIPAWY